MIYKLLNYFKFRKTIFYKIKCYSCNKNVFYNYHYHLCNGNRKTFSCKCYSLNIIHSAYYYNYPNIEYIFTYDFTFNDKQYYIYLKDDYDFEFKLFYIKYQTTNFDFTVKNLTNYCTNEEMHLDSSYLLKGIKKIISTLNIKKNLL